MKNVKLITLMFCLLANYGLLAQQFVEGELLIRLEDQCNINALVSELNTNHQKQIRLTANRKVSTNLNIWLVSFDNTQIKTTDLLESTKQLSCVAEAQVNHILELRSTTPNDTEFNSQWQYINTGANGGTVNADLDADLAWDVTTGGLTSLGDTIVVAIIDSGIDQTHTDFEDNRWINHNEIPGNGLDDDNNGYIDDRMGWNAFSHSPTIGEGNHGTAVAGIVGAKGNNSKGVAGVNWNVKLMIIQGGPPEATVIAAYDYALTMRKLYNATNGVEGAFVVVTNSSFGIDNRFPSFAPLWCAFYDSLGVHGILSCGATSNSDTDVDMFGDLPTTCPSDYLIAVNNLDQNDAKVTCGYGSVNVDLGAYGAGTYTTAKPNSTGAFGGTSAATPHVAGAVALIYSIPCEGLIAKAKIDPAATALEVKNYILNGTTPNSDLAGITVTGGRLNLNNAIQEAVTACPAANTCFEPFSTQFSNIAINTIDLSWGALSNSASFGYRYREVGTTAWTSATATTTNTTISGLSGCTNYELQLKSTCSGSSSSYSQSNLFTTDGCCNAPSGLSATTTDNMATITWNPVTIATTYGLRYRKLGVSTWTTVDSISGTTTTLSNLDICSNYVVEMKSICGGSGAPFGSSFNFSTSCGNCTALNYCPMAGQDANGEWIKQVQIGYYYNNSTSSGYSEFQTLGLHVTLDTTYEVRLSPGYSSTNYKEHFTAWIDYDQDGLFSNQNEVIFDSGVDTAGPVGGYFTVPGNAVLGHTRLRVAMRYSTQAIQCTDFDYGEVEDYCILVSDIPLALDPQPEDIESITILPNPFTTNITIDLQLAKASNLQFKLYDITGRELLQTDHGSVGEGNHQIQLTPSSTLPTGAYLLHITTDEGSVTRKLIKAQ